MRKEIIDKMMELSEEEKQILDGQLEINKDIYTDKNQFIIDSDKFLRSDDLIDIRRHTRFIEFPKHKHNYIEFNYVYEGTLTEIIDNKKITLKKGELIFLNQHIEHKLEAVSENDISINFIIKPEFFNYIFSLLDENNIVSKFFITTLYTNYNKGEYLYFKVSEDEEIQNILEKIIVEIYSENIMNKVSIKLLVALLLVELVRKPEDIEIYSVDNFEKILILSVFKYIEDNYISGTLSEISKQLNQPDYKLSKLIKKHTKFTFKELVQDRKLNKAIELLSFESLSVVEVIEIIGYENPTYFYKIFKEKYGVTPNEYRKSLIKQTV